MARSPSASRRRGSSERSSSTACTRAVAVGEEGREHAEARPDLEHDVLGAELGEPADHAEQVLVDEEVLAELLLRGRAAHGRPKAALALASSCAAELGRVLAAGLGERRDRVDDVRGLVRPAAPRLRREVWAVGLGEQPLARDGARSLAQVARPSGR